jgi:GlcNAc-P-P-Und epimerase
MIRKKEKILVTGGSGFIGTNLCEFLRKKDYLFINIDINPPKLLNQKQYWKKVDIRNKEILLPVFKKFKPTHVINLAADLGMDHSNLDNLQTNIRGVENMVVGIKNCSSIERVVFTSSLLVCENGYIPSSSTDYNPPNYYGESKVLGEKIVRSSDLECEWAIIRPTSIWGPWFDYSYKTFFKIIDKNLYFHIGDKEFQKPASFVGNTIYMIMKILLSKNKTINKKTFYLADYPWYSTREWSTTVQKTLKTNKIKSAPIIIIRFIAKLGDFIKFIFKFDPPLTSERLKNMLTGGDYPIKNTKEICSDLPFDLNNSVFLT